MIINSCIFSNNYEIQFCNENNESKIEKQDNSKMYFKIIKDIVIRFIKRNLIIKSNMARLNSINILHMAIIDCHAPPFREVK